MQAVKRIYLIDDDESLLRTLGRLLKLSGFEVVPFSSPLAFLKSLGTETGGCVITDLRMPEMSGIELVEAMERQGSILPVIFLTGRGEIADSVVAMKRGAVNFLTKPAAKEDLLAAIEEAFAIAADKRREDSEVAELRHRFGLLTPREKEVCLKVTQGLLNKQAAGELGISEKTIKVHRARVMEKLQANSMAELVRMVDRVRLGMPQAKAPPGS